MGCLFVLFVASFAMQKLLSSIQSQLFIFVFIFIRGGESKKIAAMYVKEYSAYFSFKCFMYAVLHVGI